MKHDSLGGHLPANNFCWGIDILAKAYINARIIDVNFKKIVKPQSFPIRLTVERPVHFLN